MFRLQEGTRERPGVRLPASAIARSPLQILLWSHGIWIHDGNGIRVSLPKGLMVYVQDHLRIVDDEKEGKDVGFAY